MMKEGWFNPVTGQYHDTKQPGDKWRSSNGQILTGPPGSVSPSTGLPTPSTDDIKAQTEKATKEWDEFSAPNISNPDDKKGVGRMYQALLSQLSGLDYDRSTDDANNNLEFFREAEQNQRGVDRSGMQGAGLGRKLAQATGKAAAGQATRNAGINDQSAGNTMEQLRRRLSATTDADSLARGFQGRDISAQLRSYANKNRVTTNNMMRESSNNANAIGAAASIGTDLGSTIAKLLKQQPNPSTNLSDYAP
jgi:hypothetical protein